MHNLSPDQEFIHFAFIKHTMKVLIVLIFVQFNHMLRILVEITYMAQYPAYSLTVQFCLALKAIITCTYMLFANSHNLTNLIQLYMN